MAQLTIRNVDENIVRRLRERAERNDRSLEAEIRRILVEAAGPASAEALARVDRFRERLRGRVKGDSTEIIRTARNRSPAGQVAG